MTSVSERSDISLINCPGNLGTSGNGVGEVEDTFMMGGGMDGFIGGEEILLRGLIVDVGEESGEESGEEDESMSSFVTAETMGEEMPARDLLRRSSRWTQGMKGCWKAGDYV